MKIKQMIYNLNNYGFYATEDTEAAAVANTLERLYAALNELHDEIIPNWSKREALTFIEETLRESCNEDTEAGNP